MCLFLGSPPLLAAVRLHARKPERSVLRNRREGPVLIEVDVDARRTAVLLAVLSGVLF